MLFIAIMTTFNSMRTRSCSPQRAISLRTIEAVPISPTHRLNLRGGAVVAGVQVFDFEADGGEAEAPFFAQLVEIDSERLAEPVLDDLVAQLGIARVELPNRRSEPTTKHG